MLRINAQRGFDGSSRGGKVILLAVMIGQDQVTANGFLVVILAVIPVRDFSLNFHHSWLDGHCFDFLGNGKVRFSTRFQ